MSWDIKRRIAFIESRFAYFFGFGLSLSIIVSFAGSYIYSATLFASIFPAFILSAIESNSENLTPIVYLKMDPVENKQKPVQVKLPLFRFSLYLTDFIFKFFAKKQETKLNQHQSQRSNSNQQTKADFAQIANGFTIRKTN
jgi:hypothetical protein